MFEYPNKAMPLGRLYFFLLIVLFAFGSLADGDEPAEPLAKSVPDLQAEVSRLESELTNLLLPREWKSADGKFSTKASLSKIEADQVTLIKTDGKSASVPLTKLSDVDRQFASSFQKNRNDLSRSIADAKERLAEAKQSVPPLDRLSLGMKCKLIEDALEHFKNADIKVPTRSGIWVVEVTPNGPAARAGIKQYDIIMSINKKSTRTAADFAEAIDSMLPGETYAVAGFGFAMLGGKPIWKRGDTKIMPLTRRETVMNSLEKKVDNIENTTVYQPIGAPNSPHERPYVGLYLIETMNGTLIPRMQLYFVANDWLFIKSMTIKTDSNTFTLQFDNLREVERHVGRNGIAEWVDLKMNDEIREIFSSIADSKNVTMRLNGSQFHKDRELSEEEIEGIKRIFEAEEIFSPARGI